MEDLHWVSRRTSPGCISACTGPIESGRLWAALVLAPVIYQALENVH